MAGANVMVRYACVPEMVYFQLPSFIQHKLGPVATMNSFEQVDEIILSDLRPPSSLIAEASNAVNLTSHISTFFFIVRKVSPVVSKCVITQTESPNNDSVVSIPNLFEYHNLCKHLKVWTTTSYIVFMQLCLSFHGN